MISITRKTTKRIATLTFIFIMSVLIPQTGQSENKHSINSSSLHLVTDEIEASGSAEAEVLLSMTSERSPEIEPTQQGQGDVTGKVVDSGSGEALYGATVVLKNTVIGSVTNMDGNFAISRVPAGQQTLVVRYMGYVTTEVEVNVVAGQRVVANITLSPDQIFGEEVVIYAQAMGQARAILEQINSNTIVNVVSEARLRELPDANAAESIGRLPGVSVLRDAGEGQKVAIRGMGPRFSSITIDGNRIPGTDGDRSVDLSMISPEMLAGIEVFKSIRPDMDADAIGGAVNFRMGGARSETQYRIQLEGGYNSQLEGVGNYNATFMGSQRFLKERLGVMMSINAEQVDRSAQIQSSTYRILRDAREDEPHAPIEVNNLNLNDRLSTRQRLGGGISLDWRLPNGRLFFNNTYNRQDREDILNSRRYDLTNNRQEWRPNRTERNISTLNSALSGEHKFNWFELDWRLNRSVTENNTPYDNGAWFFEPSALNRVGADLTGGPEIIPTLALNRTERAYLETLINNEREEYQQNRSASLDIKVPYNFTQKLGGYLKFGGKHYNTYRDRLTTGYRVFNWEIANMIRNSDSGFPWLLDQSGRASMMPFLTEPDRTYNIVNDTYEMAHMPDIELIDFMWDNYSDDYRKLLGTRLDDYKATERLSAGYIMTELNIGTRLMILPGVRYEYEHSDYSAQIGLFQGKLDDLREDEFVANLSDTTARRDIGMLFPMFHVRYRLTNWFDIRAARTVSTSRPSFGNLSPRFNISYDGALVQRNNTLIRPMRSTNYDLFLTFHHNRLGLFTLGGFQKQVEDLIYTRNANIIVPEEMGLPANTRLFAITEPVNNENLTMVNGYEVEWQSNLTWLPAPFNGIVINANYSRFFSETHYHSFQFRRTAQGIVGIDTFRIAPMIHQADHIANLSVGYDFKGFSSRVSMQYQGATLRSVGTRPELDQYTDDYLRFDASIRQRLFNRRLSVFANFNNIANRPDRSSQFTYDRPRNIEYYGATIDFGMEFRF